MGRFEQVWAGEREPRLRSLPGRSAAGGEPGEEPAVAAFRGWVEKLMEGAADAPSVRSLNLRKLHLTEHYREALRQAPQEAQVLFRVWDAAYRVLELLHWRLEPPAIDPPPPPAPPTFEEVRRRYKAMKRERARQAEERVTHWHPLEIARDPAPATPDDAAG